MIPISSAAPGELIWSKTPCNRGYELRRIGTLVASLRRQSLWSSEYLVETQLGSWKFRRTGRFYTGTEIVDSISGLQVATLQQDCSGGGKLVFADRQKFRITCKGFWRPVWTTMAENNQPILTIAAREKTVELYRTISLPEGRLLLLTIFTWYRMKEAEEEAATTAALVAVTS